MANMHDVGKTAVNDGIWDDFWAKYQGGVDIPGTKYPNEHLVRFVAQWRRENPDCSDSPKVLELGFGSITNMRMMAGFGMTVHGLEVSANSVERAQTAIDRLGLGDRLSVDIFDGPRLPVPDASVDILVGMECVYYNLDQAAFAAECSRVLKPGGCLLMSFFTPDHGYMDYIQGEPGGVVIFQDNHPNPRLRGLSLYLYDGLEGFRKTFGPYFDVSLGREDFDYLQIYQSWFYLRAQKKERDSARTMSFPVSAARQAELPDTWSVPADASAMLEENIGIWDRAIASTPDARPYFGERYPCEQAVRFLATWRSRLRNDSFEQNLGREDEDSMSRGRTALEINFYNPVQLLAMKTFGYQACGVSYSPEAVARCRNSLALLGESDVGVDQWDGQTLPYDDGSFDAVIALKAAYYQPDQEAFAREVARVVKPGGEVLMYYLSGRNGYMDHVVPRDGNMFSFAQDHPNPALVGLHAFLAGPGALEEIWSPFFDVEMKFFEFSDYPLFYSFQLVRGRKKAAAR